jgi:DNA-directed RNA polymerase specialized sigma24 family protein
MSDSEKLLFRLARNGSVEAFEKLTEDHQKKVYNIILNSCSNALVASELAQEVFVRTFKALRYHNDESMFAISLYRTTRVICDEFRNRLELIS